jgi:3-deoxy-manno-octulosonate cytidylyltransferase (CMP-KDO synthetase)
LTLVIIPARMNSTRLPGKPLLKIGDKTIIDRCVGQAYRAWFEPVVATDSPEIEWALRQSYKGTQVIMTGECASGTDRVAEAAEKADPEGKEEFIINYQGDMPFLSAKDLHHFVQFRERSSADIVTAYCNLDYVETLPEFKRKTVSSHVGIYGFTRDALRRFASLPQSEEEKSENLEQLRGPGDLFTWAYALFPSMPIEINTQADLDRARSCLS